ncbi:MAG: ABC transporter permease [Calditrichaeota bacterium]|nr:ABC transporter permease [Calditrichota bacterium]MBT7616623.1 ABC transporter permease [Calditrichota bacterium]MBT7787982.1 ABC transporter permease [Calditrichota bacterium]
MTIRHFIQAIKTNAKLGWDQEGNWAPPLLYLLFALIAPISGVLMLVFMYLVVKKDTSDPSFLAFLLAGSAMFLYIRTIFSGSGYAVIDDREHYKILRYTYIVPVPFPIQIVGRVSVKLMISIVGMIATISVGKIFLGIPFRPDGILWGQFAGSLGLGLIGLYGMGWMLASVMLLLDRMGWVWAEGVSGILFLAGGAIIPLSMLPWPMVWLGKILPMTYWADLWRISLYGDLPVLAQPNLSVPQLWTWLITLTIIWFVVSLIWYSICDRLARKLGRIELESFY